MLAPDVQVVVPGTGQRVDFAFTSADGSKTVHADLNPTISHDSLVSYWCAVTGCKPNRDGPPHRHMPPVPVDYSFNRAEAMLRAHPESDYIQIWDWDDKGVAARETAIRSQPVTETVKATGLELASRTVTAVAKLLGEWSPLDASTLADAGVDEAVVLYGSDGDPVAVSMLRQTGSDSMEIISYATKPGVSVVDSVSRLLGWVASHENARTVTAVADYDHHTTASTVFSEAGMTEEEPTGSLVTYSHGRESLSFDRVSLMSCGDMLGDGYDSYKHDKLSLQIGYRRRKSWA